jgi:hypothetical protein
MVRRVDSLSGAGIQLAQKKQILIFILWFTSGVVVLSALALLAQGLPPCPPVLASLLPKGAVHISGQYASAGIIGMGGAGADLPFDHPCTKSDKYPAHIAVDVQHY